MVLKSRKVFIDTQSFVKMGLDFNRPALKSFDELCKKDCLFHFTTTTVKREVEGKITSSIDEALSSLRNFRRKARILEKFDGPKIRALFEEIDEAELHANALGVFKDFMTSTKTKILSASKVDPEKILDLYFTKKAPFGIGKKKDEFPDAFSLSSLLCELGAEMAYVISEDNDIKTFCDENVQLINIETLDRFLDLYNKHENKITELVRSYVESIDEEIKKHIESYINDAGAYNEGSWEDSEVVDFKVIKVWDFEPSVVRIDDGYCLITFDVDVDYEHTVTGPDYINGIYDKEDDHIYTFDHTSHTNTSTSTFSVEIEYSYELKSGKLIDVDEVEFFISGINDGVAVNVEEYDPDYF